MGSTVTTRRGQPGGAKASGPNANRKARRLAASQVALSATPRPVPDYAKALQEQLEKRAGELERLDEIVADLDPSDYWIATMSGPMPNEWIRLRDDYRVQIEAMLNAMIRNGIAERSIQLEEARAVLVASAMRDAMRDAGIPAAKIKEVGAALRRRLQTPAEIAA